jgi:UDP-2,3-diacylglucosamine hydrolase
MVTCPWKTWSSPRLWPSDVSGQPLCPADKAPSDNTPPTWRCDRLRALPDWQHIDFISDLHLDESRPQTLAAWQNYMASTPADAVLILGDLFELWVGDDMRNEPFEAMCTDTLRAAGQRLWLGLMVGNRDFLLGQDLLAACLGHALPDPLLLEAFGQRHVLTHGDAWCLSDTDYLAFRQMVRMPAWQSQFLQATLPQRLATARGIRAQSQARKDAPTMETWADVDAGIAASHLQDAQSMSLIHGHTHRPGSEPFALLGATRHVLSDWDLDQAPERAEVLRLSSQGLTRLSLEQACQALKP